MRAFIAATLASVAVAVPAYGGGYAAEEHPTSVAAVPVYTTPAASSSPCPTPATTHKPEHAYPETTHDEVHTYSTPAAYHEAPSHVSSVAAHVETPCLSSTTIIVTLGHSATKPYATEHPTPTSQAYHTSAVAAHPVYSAEASHVPAHSVEASHVPVHYPVTSVAASLVAPYPSAPVGTGYPSVAPPAATGTAAPVKPSTLPEFVGAASNVQAAGLVAGVGAFAALFL